MTDGVEFVALYNRGFQRFLTEAASAAIRRLVKRLDADPAFADVRYRAYALATVRTECGDGFAPVCEAHFLGAEERAKYLSRYDAPSMAKRLGNLRPGDGARFAGRGYVQITGRANYERLGKLIGKPLVDQPDLALTEDAAYRILSVGMIRGAFTGKKLADYIAGDKCDYVGARRIINGQDKAAEIARDAELFEAILKESTI